MADNLFSFKKYLEHLNITPTEFVKQTGLSKNIPALWSKLTTDEKIHQESILKVIEAFPNSNIKKYFPTHKKIVEISTK